MATVAVGVTHRGRRRHGRETRVRHGNDAATNTVVATAEVAVTRDWKHAYVTNDTTTNMVMTTVPVGDHPQGWRRR
jgi:DNA-binding beta-propeller fold protein YncE